MKTRMLGVIWPVLACGVTLGVAVAGCSSSGMQLIEGTGGGSAEFDPQLPPTEAAQMEQWLAAGFYKAWVCEDAPNTKVDGAAAIHVHGVTRVCTNSLLASSSEAGGVFPAGVASVKEIFQEGSSEIQAIAVAVKTGSASQGGDGWYWYEGASTEGFGISACTGCHSAAGSDADHPGAGDFVYFCNQE